MPSVCSSPSIACRVSVWSSDTSTRTAAAEDVSEARAGFASSGRDKRTSKQLPWPGWLLTSTRPPISSTSRCVIARPRPVPPKRRVIDTSACTNSWNRPAICSALMPMPVSCTDRRSATRSGVQPSGSVSTTRRTWPAGVNLTALDSRLASTCCRRSASPRSVPRWASRLGSANSHSSSISLACAACLTSSMAWTTVVSIEKGAASTLIWPASIFEKSSTSLIRPSSIREAPWALVR